jgi:hypothetical protein
MTAPETASPLHQEAAENYNERGMGEDFSGAYIRTNNSSE